MRSRGPKTSLARNIKFVTSVRTLNNRICSEKISIFEVSYILSYNDIFEIIKILDQVQISIQQYGLQYMEVNFQN